MIIKKKDIMYRPEYDKDFSRMQELENIRVSDSQNTDPEIKAIIMKPRCEFDAFVEKENKRIDFEIEYFKETGKSLTRNSNR